MWSKITILVALIILIIALYFLVSFTNILNRTNSSLPKANVNSENEVPLEEIPKVSVVAENLSVPWALAFLPDGKILVTERGGTVKLIDNSNVLDIATIEILQENESGLHGIAVDPDFEENNYIYLYYTRRAQGENTINRVSRFTLIEGNLTDETILIDDIPGARIHDGGRIKFGPDGYLYVTTGDAAEPSLSQNTSSLAGKILRIDTEGNAHPDNPFDNLVYSYGHRNPQGITWNNNNELFATEHGPSSNDEFNIIQVGNNYGWPTITGSQTRSGMKTPILFSGSDTWAPAGLAYVNNKFYFGGLRGNSLYEVSEANGQFTLNEYFNGEFGRIRDVITGPDNMLYITTSNRDGRGVPSNNDDKIIRINPFIL